MEDPPFISIKTDGFQGRPTNSVYQMQYGFVNGEMDKMTGICVFYKP
jgi:hypothetical protein